MFTDLLPYLGLGLWGLMAVLRWELRQRGYTR